MHISLDLETLGTSAGCVILSIGAVKFDPFGESVVDTFYSNIDIESSVDFGLEIEPKTLKWWMQQDKQAKDDLFKNEKPIAQVLENFVTWLGVENRNNILIWGNGSDFDNAILSSTYSKAGCNPPWLHQNNRCLRTLLSLADIDKKNHLMTGTLHNALDDAIYQAHLCQIAYKKLSRVT